MVANGEVRRQQALAGIEMLNAADSKAGWRLPNVNELESLVDCSRAQPALALAMHSYDLPDAVYWSSTTSRYGPERAWALLLTGPGPGSA